MVVPRIVHAGANDELKVILIGCGGRGSCAGHTLRLLDASGSLAVEVSERDYGALYFRFGSEHALCVARLGHLRAEHATVSD